MQQLSHQAEIIFYQALDLFYAYWDYVAAGILLLLLFILLLTRIRRGRGSVKAVTPKIEKSAEKQSSGNFFEVDHRPVIVYRRSEKEENEGEQKHAEEETPEVEDLTAQPEAHDDEAEMSLPEETPIAQTAPAPAPARETRPASKPPAAAESKEDRDASTKAVQHRLLPLLESDLANIVLRLFTSQNYEMEIVYQGHYGADLIGSSQGTRIFVQVKDWKKKVRENTVLEARNFARANRCDLVLIVSAGFDRSAVKKAKTASATLWNKKMLHKQETKFTFDPAKAK